MTDFVRRRPRNGDENDAAKHRVGEHTSYDPTTYGAARLRGAEQEQRCGFGQPAVWERRGLSRCDSADQQRRDIDPDYIVQLDLIGTDRDREDGAQRKERRNPQGGVLPNATSDPRRPVDQDPSIGWRPALAPLRWVGDECLRASPETHRQRRRCRQRQRRRNRVVERCRDGRMPGGDCRWQQRCQDREERGGCRQPEPKAGHERCARGQRSQWKRGRNLQIGDPSGRATQQHGERNAGRADSGQPVAVAGHEHGRRPSARFAHALANPECRRSGGEEPEQEAAQGRRLQAGVGREIQGIEKGDRERPKRVRARPRPSSRRKVGGSHAVMSRNKSSSNTSSTRTAEDRSY